MSATLTWSAYHGESNLQSTFAASNQGAIQLMNQYFTTLAAFGDFPWEVCSHEGTTAPWFVTLKRKSGAAGRIVFIGVASSPGTTYNPQLGLLNWNAASVRAGYFPNATSDTPANILSTSGDVFTNPSGYSGLGPHISMTTGTSNLTAWACQDGVYMRYGAAASTANSFAVGALAEDDAGIEIGISAIFTNGSPDNLSTAAPPVTTSGNAGTHAQIGGQLIQFGTGWTWPGGIAPYLRDNGVKRSWFLPRSLASFGLSLGNSMKYKLRQIAYGPTPLVAYEQLTDTGAVLKAVSVSPNASNMPWLVNFQV